jgi:transcriptional regulator with XRE-family HTH domain
MERSNDRLVAAFAGVLRERRERANVSARFVSFLETGRRQPSLSALASLSSGLGISMTDIVSELEARYRETAQR